MQTERTAAIYRFHNKVALSFDSTQQLYMTPEMALKLAKELETYAKDCQTTKFTSSQLKTITLNE